jgi:hypothetical protein
MRCLPDRIQALQTLTHLRTQPQHFHMNQVDFVQSMQFESYDTHWKEH